jgi:signal transduction histidine kinase
MADAPTEPKRVASYFARAFGVLLLTGLAHAILAHALLGPMLTGTGTTPGPYRRAITVAVLVSILAQFAIAYWRTSRGSPDQVASSVTWVARVVPLLAAIATTTIIIPKAEAVGASSYPFVVLAPIIGVSWGTALLLAVPQKRLLHAIAIRTRTSRPGVIRVVDTASLAGSYARALAGVVAALSCIVLAAVLVRADPSILQVDLRSAAAIITLLGFVAVCAIAGWSLGQSPGRDVTSIARRLDALGYNAKYSADWPVAVTSFDDLGLLFRRIEDLRTHLSQEVRLYQDALDRTREADAAKAEFLAAVSHELRTPLNSICGFAQLLLDGVPSPLTEPQSEDVRLIRTGGHQLLALINDILDISMIESGELSLSFAPTNLGDLADEVVDIHRPLTRDRPLIIRTEIDPALPEVNCDRRRISQVLTNLVSNAIKFTEEGEIVIELRYSPELENVILSVRDTGVGISSEELPTIFDEYRQVGSLKRRAKGTGLGLAIARSIAIHHGGSLGVESRIDQGSNFMLELPVAPSEEPSMIDMTEERARAFRRAAQKSMTLVPLEDALASFNPLESTEPLEPAPAAKSAADQRSGGGESA